MLRLAFRCSFNLVHRTKPRGGLGRSELTKLSAFAPDSNLAQKLIFGPPNLRVEQPRPLMTESKSAQAKKRSEKPIVEGSGGLKVLDSWISRPSFEQRVLQNFDSNWIAFSAPNYRPNDFKGILIPGGIGVGKTRAALEVPNIVAQSLKPDSDDIKVVWRISLDYRGIPEIAWRNDKDTNPANVLFGLFGETMIANAQLSPDKVVTTPPKTLMELVQGFINFNKLKPSDSAVLYLHVDEFQMDPDRMALLSREVGNYLTTENRPNVLVILILSGVGSQEFIKKTLSSNYRMSIMHLNLSVEPEWINSLVDRFIQRIPSKQQPHVIQFREKSPEIFFKLLYTTGGIPVYVWKLLNILKYSPTEGSPISAAQRAFELCCADLEDTYNTGPYSSWFDTKDHVVLFLQKAFFKEHVTRDYKLNGVTVGELEESGLIYLESVQGPKFFTIGLPFIILHNHNFVCCLNLFTGLDCLAHPLKPFDETKFEDFIAQIYAFSWRLLSYHKTAEVTLQYLHRDCLTASQELLDKKITLPHASTIALEQMAVLAKGSEELGEFQLKGKKDMNFNLKQPATFVLQTRKRFAGADVVISGQLQIQLKWSQYVGDLRAIRAAKSRSDPSYYLTAGLVEKEIKKILPDMPLVIVSPKVPHQSLEKAQLAGKFPQLGLITDKKCMQFLEPFY